MKPVTKESGRPYARVIAEQFLLPLPVGPDAEELPGAEIRRLLASAYLEVEAERDALREALQKIVDLPINEEASAGFHFASVRQVAREVLTRLYP